MTVLRTIDPTLLMHLTIQENTRWPSRIKSAGTHRRNQENGKREATARDRTESSLRRE